MRIKVSKTGRKMEIGITSARTVASQAAGSRSSADSERKLGKPQRAQMSIDESEFKPVDVREKAFSYASSETGALR
jgi:hypothetical protein